MGKSRLLSELDEQSREKLEHYEQSLNMLAEALPGDELVAKLRLELEAIRAL